MNFETINTKAVIVTYSMRWGLLSKTLASVEKQKEIDEVILVQNGVEYDLEKKVKEMPNVKVITNVTNEGSAGGFYGGLKFLSERRNHDFNILILDDDNILDDNVFMELKKAEKMHTYSDRHVWSLFRPEVQSKSQFEMKKEKSLGSYSNTINGFTLMHFFSKDYMSVDRKYNDVVKIITAPYSGLIFPASLLTRVGLPNKKFYLYSDDIDFTLRISKAGYDIYQCHRAKSYDQGIAWQKLDHENKKNRGAFFLADEIYRPLYTYRNEVYISYTELKSNAIIFWLNYFMLQSWMFVSFMPKNRRGFLKFRLLKKAMRQGIQGKLGKSVWIEQTRKDV